MSSPRKKGGSKFRFRYRKYWQNTPPNSAHHHRPEFDTTMEPDNPRVPPPVLASGPSRERETRHGRRGGGTQGRSVGFPDSSPFHFAFYQSAFFGSGSCFHSGPLRANKTRQGQHVRPLLVSVEILLCWSCCSGQWRKIKAVTSPPAGCWVDGKFVQGCFNFHGAWKKEKRGGIRGAEGWRGRWWGRWVRGGCNGDVMAGGGGKEKIGEKLSSQC